ncbi:MAG: cold shock domain-containing protein [Candidatus Bathyarchaeota archaeon]|nr:cold shock domain-containing protein [Candidatus Bathyarchaeota archaeon]
MNGKIVKYFSRRGFGFITPVDSQEEIFFHVSSYPEQMEPEIGKDVEFELIETPKGKEAKNVKVLADASEEEDVEAESPEEDEAPEEEDVEAESPEEDEAPEEEDVEAESPEEDEAPEEEDVEAESPEEDEAPEEEAPEEEVSEASGLGVGDIKGVGKATEEKLVGAGFETVESIAAVDGDALSEKAGVSAKVAAKIVAAAKELLE